MADDEEAAPGVAVERVEVGREQHRLGVEAVAFVCDAEPDQIGQQLGGDRDAFGRIVSVAAPDCVGQCLGQGNAQPEDRMTGGAQTGETVPAHQLDHGFDVIHIARHPERHRLGDRGLGRPGVAHAERERRRHRPLRIP